MAHKKTIAIIGATGNVGSAIAKYLSVTNHRLLLMANELEQLDTLQAELKQSSLKAEIENVTCAREASWEADIIIVASPASEGRKIAEQIRDVAIGKIVISVSQPLNGQINVVTNTSPAEELQQLLPYSKVVKTFNTALALDHRKLSDVNFTETFIAGNNGWAVDTVAELVRSAGFTPIPVGDLSASRTLEKMKFKNTGQSIKSKPNWREWWKGLAFFKIISAVI